MITIVMMENLCGLFSQSKVLLSELKILSLPALDNLPEWFDQIKELNPKNQWELNLFSNGCQGLTDCTVSKETFSQSIGQRVIPARGTKEM